MRWLSQGNLSLNHRSIVLSLSAIDKRRNKFHGPRDIASLHRAITFLSLTAISVRITPRAFISLAATVSRCQTFRSRRETVGIHLQKNANHYLIEKIRIFRMRIYLLDDLQIRIKLILLINFSSIKEGNAKKAINHYNLKVLMIRDSVETRAYCTDQSVILLYLRAKLNNCYSSEFIDDPSLHNSVQSIHHSPFLLIQNRSLLSSKFMHYVSHIL